MFGLILVRDTPEMHPFRVSEAAAPSYAPFASSCYVLHSKPIASYLAARSHFCFAWHRSAFFGGPGWEHLSRIAAPQQGSAPFRDTSAMLNRHDVEEERPLQAQSLVRFLPGRAHSVVTEWQREFWRVHYNGGCHQTMLTFVGGPMQGKTCRALSIFGVEKTLHVNCQSSPIGRLPALNSFIPGQHIAILFDDIRLDQILENRSFFTVPPQPDFTSSQSLLRVTETWGYHTALLACTNSLPFTVSDGLSEPLAMWMNNNLRKVTLQEGERWF